MYGFNNSIPFKKFIGSKIIQICIGENEAILRFDSDCSITVQSFERFLNDNHLRTADGKTLLPPGLGQAVTDISVQSRSCVIIAFEKGLILLSDDTEEFESVIFEVSGSRYVA